MFSDTGQLEYSDQAGGGVGRRTTNVTLIRIPTSHQQSFWRKILDNLDMFISCFMFTSNYAHE